MEENQLFIQLEPSVNALPNQEILLKDIATAFCLDKEIEKSVLNIKILNAGSNKKNTVVFVLDIINRIKQKYKKLDIIVFGEPEILINVGVNKKNKGLFNLIRVFIICIIIFIGAGLAITYFHKDVDMENTHKAIYFLVTGEKSERPLILQIPYSIGIGIGMASFFNHVFKKKWKKEPSPLEVEMYLYNKNINDYVLDRTKHIKDND